MPPPSPVEVRSRKLSDDAFIRELSREAFREYSERAQVDTERMVRAHETLVAARGDQPIGFVVLQTAQPGSAYVAALAVLEDERGRGVGKKLLAAAEHLARDRGAHEVRLTTADSNLSALQLFHRAGFRRFARRGRYYGRGQDAVELRKTITVGRSA